MGAQKNIDCLNWINAVRIVVQDAGLAVLDDKWNAKNVCAPFTRVYFISSGGGSVRLQGKSVPLRANHVYLIPSWTMFDYACMGEMEQLYFHIFIKQPNGLDLFSQIEGCKALEMEEPEMARVVAAFRRQDIESACLVEEFLYRAVLRLAASAIGTQAAVARNYSTLVLDLFEYIQKNISFRVTIDTLAQAMNVSRSTMTKRFRAETGMPLGRYVDQLLVQEIQRRLLLGTETISQIASALDFCDQFYMSHYFKRQTKLSPMLYRRRFQGIS